MRFADCGRGFSWSPIHLYHPWHMLLNDLTIGSGLRRTGNGVSGCVCLSFYVALEAGWSRIGLARIVFSLLVMLFHRLCTIVILLAIESFRMLGHLHGDDT